MKLDHFKKLNIKDARMELKLLLSAAVEEHEYPEDGVRTRNRDFKDTNPASCKAKYLKLAVADPFKALKNWFDNKQTSEACGLGPQQVLSNPTPVWDCFVSGILSDLENEPSENDIRRIYYQICSCAAKADRAGLKLLDFQKNVEWVANSHEYQKMLAAKLADLQMYCYDNYYNRL